MFGPATAVQRYRAELIVALNGKMSLEGRTVDERTIYPVEFRS